MSSAVQIRRSRLGNMLLRQQSVRGWKSPLLSLALARQPRHALLSTGCAFRNAATLSTSGKDVPPRDDPADEKSQNENGSSSSEQNQSKQGRVLYERRPDWYIRLIPLLIVLDIAMLYVLFCSIIFKMFLCFPDSECAQNIVQTLVNWS